MDGYEKLAEIAKVLSHPVRVQILQILRQDETCVCHMEAILSLRQAYISQQLARLREAGLVTDRREGLNVYYALVDESILHLLDAAIETATKIASQSNSPIEFPALEPAADTCPCPKCTKDC